MKRIVMMILMFTVVATAVSAGTNSILIGTNNEISATLLNYQPVPAQPGDTIDVWIQVTNDGGEASASGTVTIIDSYPFSVESATDKVKEFTSIPARETFLIKTRVRIDKNAHEGTNYLSIEVRENGKTDYLTADLPITIQGRSSALSIMKASSVPAMLTPGQEGRLSLIIQNIGETKLRNVQVELNLADLSVAPTTSSNAKTIASLAGGESSTFDFDLLAFPDAAANAYQLPVMLRYEDEQGNTLTQNETIGLIIGSAPELLVYLEQNDLSSETKQGNVVIKFVNKGLDQIKLLELEVLENENVSVLSESPVLYVGNIDADDYESADLTLKIMKSSVNVPLKVTYKNALNQPYEETIMLHLNAKNGNGKTSSTLWIWILVIIVLVLAFWFWRRRREKRTKKRRE